MDLGFRMHAEKTPNPNCIKWVLGQEVADVASASFSKSQYIVEGISSPKPGVTTEVSPLAAPILEIEGVEGVFLGPTFVTVTKNEGSEWTEIAVPIVAAIKSWAESGESALGPGFERPATADDDEIVALIKTILERDIRPYVEQDGGEITFASYHDGVVEVYLQGACAGCPSSTITLKMGIEARLKEEIPEVKSVIAF